MTLESNHIATIAINFYRTSSRLFVTGGIELSSEEGTTRGCPLSMALYAVSVILLINKCRDTATMDCNPATQVWYADDAAAGGSMKALHRFWNLLARHGPAYSEGQVCWTFCSATARFRRLKALSASTSSTASVSRAVTTLRRA